MEDVKIKISVLWLFSTVASLAVVTLVFMEPGVIAQIEKGEIYGEKIGPELLLVMAILYYLVPLVMAFLSLTLKDSINRWANIIAGIAFAGLALLDLIAALEIAMPAYGILIDISRVVAPALIVWYAWKWPKK